MPPAAVSFDLDDTLCVPERDRATVLEEATAAVDAPPLDRTDYLDAHRRNLTGETRAPIFAELLDEPPAVSPDALARTYRERINEAIRPLAGVRGLLDGLRAEYTVGLLTNGPSLAQRAKLETLGLAEAFDAVVVSGELPAGKPDRRAFDALLEELDVPAAELVYVGDDVEADVGGAAAAGCRAVQVVHDRGPAPDPRAVAHVEVDRLVETLPDLLAELG